MFLNAGKGFTCLSIGFDYTFQGLDFVYWQFKGFGYLLFRTLVFIGLDCVDFINLPFHKIWPFVVADTKVNRFFFRS